MALGSEVNDAVNLVLAHNFEHTLIVRNVRLHEGLVGLPLNIFEVGKITCIGQQVEVHNVVLGVLINKQPHNVRANKSRTTGDNYITL